MLPAPEQTKSKEKSCLISGHNWCNFPGVRERAANEYANHDCVCGGSYIKERHKYGSRSSYCVCFLRRHCKVPVVFYFCEEGREFGVFEEQEEGETDEKEEDEDEEELELEERRRDKSARP